MTYKEARIFLDMQNRNIRKINNYRFVHDGYEYRVIYEGGFAAFVRIDRRQIGKRNFKYYKGFGAYHCLTVGEVRDMALKEVGVA